MDEYQTLRSEGEAEFVERRSRFIGRAKPVKTEEEAVAFINEIRANCWDATHNVYAYSLRGGQVKRYSDDGEPQGTAGIPVLDVLQKSGTVDAVLVVTRYFGGVLLGAGGLVRAYSHGASIALEAAGLMRMGLCALCTLVCDYAQYGRVAALVPEHGGTVDHADFGAEVAIRFHIPPDKIGGLNADLADATCGQCAAKEDGRMFYPLA